MGKGIVAGWLRHSVEQTGERKGSLEIVDDLPAGMALPSRNTRLNRYTLNLRAGLDFFQRVDCTICPAFDDDVP